VTMRLPSGEKEADNTGPWCPSSVFSLRLDESQTRAVRSLLAETTLFPSGENEAKMIADAWPLSTASSSPLEEFQIRLVLRQR